MSEAADITALLLAWGSGEEAARNRVVEAVYDELRRVAQRHLRHERADHSLTPTALVHETYLKLIDQRRVRWQNRAHFYAVAAQVMRRLLVDHARARGATKRGIQITIPLDGIDVAAGGRSADLIALDSALDKLAALDARQARLVELRYFGGLSEDEVARVLNASPRIIRRDWQFSKAWLARELNAL